MRLLATKDRAFTAEHARLHVGVLGDDEDPFWRGLSTIGAMVIGRKIKLVLPAVRRRSMPLDLVSSKSFDPKAALSPGSTEVDTVFCAGVSTQATRVKSQTALKYLGQLSDPKRCPEDPVASVKVEYKADKHWGTLFELSVSPREVWKALRAVSEDGEQWAVEGAGWLDVDSTGRLLARPDNGVGLAMPNPMASGMPEPELEPEPQPSAPLAHLQSLASNVSVESVRLESPVAPGPRGSGLPASRPVWNDGDV